MELSDSQVESFFHDGCERMTFLFMPFMRLRTW